jgi:hypothetical protein
MTGRSGSSLVRSQQKSGGRTTSLAIIQASAGDPEGGEYTGNTGNYVDVDGVSTEVPIDCVEIKLAEETGTFPSEMSVSTVSGAIELIATVPTLNGANAYFREPALASGRVIRVVWAGDHWQEHGTVFDSWDDECDI